MRDWSLAILGALEPVLTPEQFRRGVTAVDDFKLYLRDLVARRAREQHLDESEILSKLIAASDLAPGAGEPARDGGAAERMSDLELLHNCIFILNAGHETTTNLIGNGVDLLIRNPDALRDLRAHPELIESAVEEFLRLESSNQLGNRRAARGHDAGRRRDARRAPTSTSASAPPTAIRLNSPIPTASTSAGIPTATSPSPPASTPAPGCRWRAWKRRSRSAPLVQRFARIERAGPFVRGGRARFRGFLQYPVRVG